MKLLIFSIILAVSCSTWLVYADDDSKKFSDIEYGDEYSDDELNLLNLTNIERVRKGCNPVTMNNFLTKVARAQSDDMARHNQLSHTVKGKHLALRLNQSGYNYRHIGENIAKSKADLSHVVKMWMKSPDHRKNLLKPQFKEVGFGITKSKDGYRYFTQVFGAQK